MLVRGESMTEKNFLSIDWDYFIVVHRIVDHSYRETMQDIMIKWYRDYLIGIDKGEALEKNFELGEVYEQFRRQVIPSLIYEKGCKLILSESHADAYQEAVLSRADHVYLLDAHSDLGYGGLNALEYEVNCANWLGKLLKEGKIKKATIIYSPYTREYQEEFEEIIAAYPVEFISIATFLERKLKWTQIHMCRSGPWTPPWYDDNFYELAQAFNRPIEDHVGGKREWHPKTLSLAERINYRLGVI